MARRRNRLANIGFVALSAVAATPLAAQSTNTATPPPSASPAPTGNAIGPPQLRDFNLNGTVTQPAPTQPAPTQAPPPARPPRTTPPVASAPADRAPVSRAIPAPARSAPPRTAPVSGAPTVAAPDRDPAPDAVSVALPPPSDAPIAAEPSFSTPPAPEPVTDAPAAPVAPGSARWPWFIALLLVALGAAFLWWRRQQGEARHAADSEALGALVAIPDAVPASLPDEATGPSVSGKATTPARPSQPAPDPAPTSAPAPFAEPIPGGIVASGLKPKLDFELVPLRAETDAAAGAALTFDIILINRGSAPARDVLVDAQMINAGPQIDADVGRFFTQGPGNGERVAMIPPMGRVAIQARLEVPAAELAPLVVDGRKLLVPVVAINALYRWNGGEMKDSSSFLVGRGAVDDGKLAPFRLDRGARSWSGLAARLHSSGLQR